jgi:hypothetical protein
VPAAGFPVPARAGRTATFWYRSGDNLGGSMKKTHRIWKILLCLSLPAAVSTLSTAAHAADYSLGLGIHYWRAVDDLGGSFDNSGVAGMFSYQYIPAGLFKLEGDLEYFPKGFGGADDTAWSPQVYVLLGNRLYAGVGAGVIYSQGFSDEFSDVFYAARVGTDFTLLPRTHLDINANYRFKDWNQIDQADTDTITLGAVLRIRF